MTIEGRREFDASLKENEAPPQGWPAELQALWWDGKGEWDKAHALVSEGANAAQCHVHGYLHRKEGDDGNARYWYSKARENFPAFSVAQEWASLVDRYLQSPAD